ncbi:hypothetical protein [Klebsiella pneumoniae]|uniref:hypothetical protein n=1 Tax=Klebsiella pneumoniae TaxID=573 RepID=UPI001C9B8877|nr:hypothetical protein [Klebsiella pneumoniae]EIX9112893.1 hypothetical protein [Klebsiella pneumoniae]EJD3763492.1 hypothetical protein [Klebsiella pneumoniae]MEA4196639.1 hypothetical protein [Klebsiella pneumoniae]
MKKLIIALAIMASFGAQANRCDYPDQIAKDGSLCGARAASVRPGGYTPPPEYSALVQTAQPLYVGRDKVSDYDDMGLRSISRGDNTYPADFEFRCNGDMNVSFAGGRYISSVEQSEVPDEWYDVSLVAHNHYLDDTPHQIFRNGEDANISMNKVVNAHGNGVVTVGEFSHA